MIVDIGRRKHKDIFEILDDNVLEQGISNLIMDYTNDFNGIGKTLLKDIEYYINNYQLKLFYEDCEYNKLLIDSYLTDEGWDYQSSIILNKWYRGFIIKYDIGDYNIHFNYNGSLGVKLVLYKNGNINYQTDVNYANVRVNFH